MLADPALASIVCWAPTRDSFVVRDMGEFTKVGIGFGFSVVLLCVFCFSWGGVVDEGFWF